ncbi:MAG: triacylglycerol lipase [Actinomycetota bacterium]|nr:triacylglycerol lipase [Actinomycetota bacterium]
MRRAVRSSRSIHRKLPTRSVRPVLLGACTALLAVVGGTGVASGAQQYPVPYTFSANVLAAVAHPGSAPPGSNDWSCRPSAAHPRPVVLVHGLFANMTDNWQTMSPLLANNRYCVFALTYGVEPGATFPSNQFGGLIPMEKSAAQLSTFVNRVLTATGARTVDIVGHSEGATMPDYYIEYLGGAAKVTRYVGISGVKHGTTLHGIGTLASEFAKLFPGAPDATSSSCASCQEFLVGSPYITRIEARAPARRVIYTNIATRYDELVSPYTSSFLAGPNVTNITLQDHCALDFSDHLSIISSPITGRYILNALDPAHARPPVCTLVLPAA